MASFQLLNQHDNAPLKLEESLSLAETDVHSNAHLLQNRDIVLSQQPMPNFKSTAVKHITVKNDDDTNLDSTDTVKKTSVTVNSVTGKQIEDLGQYMPKVSETLSFWASYKLNSRPRRIALLLDDCQEEYRTYAENFGIIKPLEKLIKCFRKKGCEADYSNVTGSSSASYFPSCPIIWSVWSRTFSDGISNSMDRWYGSRGLNISKGPENALYIFEGKEGMKVLKELEPSKREIEDGYFYHSKSLDMFWTYCTVEKGSSKKSSDKIVDYRPISEMPTTTSNCLERHSYLDYKLKQHSIDTIVLTGLWTDECIISTAFAAFSRGYDVIIPKDAVATATANHKKALQVLAGTCSLNIETSDEIVDYMEGINDYNGCGWRMGRREEVKGKTWEDGRKDLSGNINTNFKNSSNTAEEAETLSDDQMNVEE